MSFKKKIKNRVDDLQNSQLSLRHKFIEVNDELLDCNRLKANYEQMVASKITENEKLQKQIDEISSQIDRLNYSKNIIESKIEKLSEYEDIEKCECLAGENIARKCNTLCK